MKTVCLRIGMALVTVFGLALRHIKPLSASSEPLAHVRNTFEFTVSAPYKVAAPLLGAEAERVWGGPDWKPQFLYPRPAQDKAAAVFSVGHGQHQNASVTTVFLLSTGTYTNIS